MMIRILAAIDGQNGYKSVLGYAMIDSWICNIVSAFSIEDNWPYLVARAPAAPLATPPQLTTTRLSTCRPARPSPLANPYPGYIRLWRLYGAC